MLCSAFSPEETEIWDGSARFLSPCKYLTSHYLRVVPMVERLLHKHGDKLCDLEGADIVNLLYEKFAAMERLGIWAPPMLDTDADAMGKYVMGTAKLLIERMNSERFEVVQLRLDIPERYGSVEEVLEKEERLTYRDRLRERLSDLFASMGIDERKLYEYLLSDEATDKEEKVAVLLKVCYATDREKEKLCKLLRELGEMET